ncbi:MAG: S8 family serine peptidase [Chloroflexi bacterium]|nr:S8 family serine peptidase [Chloroflexota bacterium]
MPFIGSARWRGALIGLLLVHALLGPIEPLTEARAAPAGDSDAVVVLFRPDTTPAQRAAAIGRHGGAARTRVARRLPRLARLAAAPGDAAALARRMRADPAVLLAAPDRRVRAAAIPSEYSATRQPALARVSVPAAWAAGFDGAGVTLAIIDTGLDITHPEFATGRIIAPAVFVSDPTPPDVCGPTTPDIFDNAGHGTHVAGIAAAGGGSGDTAGIAWAARIMPIKVLDACGSGSYFDVVQGIDHAVAHGARAINLSFGGYLDPHQTDDAALIAIVQTAVDDAHARGALLVAAAGNDGANLDVMPYYPATASHVVAVAATTVNDEATAFSNRGAAVAVSAPGAGILSTLPTYPTHGHPSAAPYGYLTGTSMAAPHVTGLAALALQRDASLTPDDVAAILGGTAVDRGAQGRDQVFGIGRVSGAALTRAAPAPRRYFAEGYTGAGFSAYLTLQNTGTTPALALLTLQYDGAAAGALHRRYVALPAASRTTLDLNRLLGADRAFATIVAADSAIVVERPMYFDYQPGAGPPIDGGHLGAGAPRPAVSWFLAEGWTGEGFDEFLTIQNPATERASVEITYAREDTAPVTKPLAIPAGQRATIAVHEPSGGVGRNQAVAIRVDSLNQVGVVVERPMYFRYGAGLTGGHTVTGATTPSATWYFAEGYTGEGFDEYLTLLNPTSVAGTAELTYALDSGQTVTRQVSVPALRRTTVIVHDQPSADNPGGLGRGFAAALKVVSTVPVVAERPMYFVYHDAAGRRVDGGHSTLGAVAPRSLWHFAEGYTGDGFDEFLALFNPSATPVTARITYYLDGQPPRSVDVAVAAMSRSTVAVHDGARGVGRGLAVAASVEALSGRTIVAERVMYFTFAGGITGGHAALGQ